MGFIDFLEEGKKTKAMVFDVDDTLLTTKSKIKVVDSNGKVVNQLSPQDYNTYKLKKDETYDFSDFRSAEVLKNTAQKTVYWQVAQNVNDAVKRGDSNTEIYILTARPDTFKSDLYRYLKTIGLDTLKMNNVFTVGDRGASLSIAQLKKISLKHIKKNHSEVKFFDDDDANIELAKELKTIKTQKANV